MLSFVGADEVSRSRVYCSELFLDFFCTGCFTHGLLTRTFGRLIPSMGRDRESGQGLRALPSDARKYVWIGAIPRKAPACLHLLRSWFWLLAMSTCGLCSQNLASLISRVLCLRVPTQFGLIMRGCLNGIFPEESFLTCFVLNQRGLGN